MKRLFALVAIAAIAYAVQHHTTVSVSPPDQVAPTSVTTTPSPSGEISGAGTVIRILPDDNKGNRHQRFILRLASGQTLLVAHNIDLAPRVSPLHEGDTVEYHGEYVWNDKGGVVHWTHRDPSGRHTAGWLKHDGQIFQ